MAASHPTRLVRPCVLADALAGAAGESHDPGPVPPEPHPSTTTISLGPAASIGITRNIAYTGCTGLTLTSGDTSVTATLPAAAVDALLTVLHANTGVPYEPAPGGDLR